MKIGYARVSTDEQDEALQISALEAAGCERIVTDKGVSGKSMKRKGLDELVENLQEGDTLVVWKLDRLGRTTVGLLLLLDELREKGVRFMFLTEGIDSLTPSPSGNMAMTMLAAVAEFERALISERTKAGMAAAKARGKHIGRPKALTADQVAHARDQIKNHGATVTSMAEILSVNRVTLTNALKS